MPFRSIGGGVADEDLVQDRCADHSKAGPAALDQGDVDGELAIAIDELLGAVQRIHQPIAPPTPPLGVGRLCGFLGKDGQTRDKLLQAGANHLMGG